MTHRSPRHAMVLAAGLGKRMRAVSGDLPKPLVRVADKPLIEHALDRLAAASVSTIVVNTHYKADQIEAHLVAYADHHNGLRITISREETLLETGGGVAHALAYLGDDAFFVHNSDAVLRGGAVPALERLSAAWDDTRMDALLLLCPLARAFGHGGGGDFKLESDGRLTRAPGDPDGLVFTGVQLLHPRLFADAPSGPYSLNRHYDEAGASGRLFGVAHDGEWFHVGSPEGLAAATDGLRTPTP